VDIRSDLYSLGVADIGEHERASALRSDLEQLSSEYCRKRGTGQIRFATGNSNQALLARIAQKRDFDLAGRWLGFVCFDDPQEMQSAELISGNDCPVVLRRDTR